MAIKSETKAFRPTDEELDEAPGATPHKDGAWIYGITIDQPEASALVGGAKALVTRTHGWPGDPDVRNGWVLLHAGEAAPHPGAVKALRNHFWKAAPSATKYPTCAIIGLAQIRRIANDTPGVYVWHFLRVMPMNRAYVRGLPDCVWTPPKDLQKAYRPALEDLLKKEKAIHQRTIETAAIRGELTALMARAKHGCEETQDFLRELNDVEDQEAIREVLLARSRARVKA